RPRPNAPPSRCSMPGSTPTPDTYLQICWIPDGSEGPISFHKRSTLVRVCTLFQVPSNSAMSLRGITGSPFVGREERSESRPPFACWDAWWDALRYSRPTSISSASALSFGFIRPREFELAQVFGVDAGHVVAREAGVVEVLEVFVAFGHGFDEVRQILVDQPVGTDGFADFLDA